jgi:hypothetical protein
VILSRTSWPKVREFVQALAWQAPVLAGPIPTVLDPDGYYPYPSFAATEFKPVRKSFRFVLLENEHLKALVCPDLGGRLHSLIHKASGKECLYVPPVLRPSRILPRMAFLSGGIETSFPISHSPVQIEPLAYETAKADGRVYVWCGERELHAGMQWTIEFSLGPGETFLSHRTWLHNPGPEAHTWMSWSNAALPARLDTEFHFPQGPVLQHEDTLSTIDWRRQGPRRQSQVKRMTGYFWKRPDVFAFGGFTPSLGSGLYHVADSRDCAGIKLWTYGQGRDDAWARESSGSRETYIEIQAGPLADQATTGELQPGQSHLRAEFWHPTSRPMDIRKLKVPKVDFAVKLPAFGYQKRQGAWPVSLAGCGDDYERGIWFASRGDWKEAVGHLNASGDDRAKALAGRIYRAVFGDFGSAVASFRKIKDASFALHPQIVFERDLALAGLGKQAFAERRKWLNGSSDERVIERRMALWVDEERGMEALKLLSSHRFQKIHQRYERTELWKLLSKGEPPESLGEDRLARFGAYRETSS